MRMKNLKNNSGKRTAREIVSHRPTPIPSQREGSKKPNPSRKPHPLGGGWRGLLPTEVCYRGVPYKDIADAWMCAEYGHLPAVGERNAAYYALVQGCMRYICDFNEDMVLAATPDYGLSEQERRQCARSAIGARRYAAIPRKLVAFLETVGVASTENQKGIRRSNENASGLV